MDVIFRVLGGETIALFPGIASTPDRPDLCMSYMHVGQHSAASADLSSTARLATPEEYGPLMLELQRIGYENLRVIRRQTRKHFAARRRLLDFYE